MLLDIVKTTLVKDITCMAGKLVSGQKDWCETEDTEDRKWRTVKRGQKGRRTEVTYLHYFFSIPCIVLIEDDYQESGLHFSPLV